MAKKMGGGGAKKSGGGGGMIMILLVVLMVVGGGLFTFTRFRAAQEVQQQQQQQPQDPTQDPNYVATTPVLVVQEEVHPYEPVTEYNVAIQEVPVNSVYPENTVTAMPDITDNKMIFAVDLLPNTIVTEDMLWDTTLDEDITKTSRTITVNYISTTTKLAAGDYIEIRMKKTITKDTLAYSDEVILAKKRLLAVSGNQLTLNLDEKEQLLMSVASVDKTYTNSNTQLMDNTKADIYCTKYALPQQDAAIATYDNETIRQQLETNPMLIEMALTGQLTGNEGIDITGGQQVPVQQQVPTVDAYGRQITGWTENGQPIVKDEAGKDVIGVLPQTQAQDPNAGVLPPATGTTQTP